MASLLNFSVTPNLLELVEACGGNPVTLAGFPICGDEATDSPSGPTELLLSANEGPIERSICADEI